jgi:M6 family metalloprotease-like protein
MKNSILRVLLRALCVAALSDQLISAAVVGERPLLVVLVEFQDRRFADRDYLAQYQSRIFGPDEPNVNAYFSETSHDHFTYVPATPGDNYGDGDGMVRVLMNVRQNQAPTGREFRNQVLTLANSSFDFSVYDTNNDGQIQPQELAVLMIQANGGESGKTMTAGEVTCDRTSLNGISVPVMSENAPNYVLYHELAHAVDLGGHTGMDLYNIRDGIKQKVIMWTVDASGGVTRAGSVSGEIALELSANTFGAGAAVTAYRDQNGELRLANYDISSADHPALEKTASAGLANDLSVCQLSPLRIVTALRSGGGNLKLIVWDVNLNWEFTRRGDYTAGEATDIEVTAVSASRIVVACRTEDGNLKLIAFDVSANGELTRRGSYTAGGATEINVITIDASRVVAAVRQAGGNLKVIAFDISQSGEFTRTGDWEAGAATEIDLARISLRRVAASVRSNSGNLKVILFDINARGEVDRLGSYEGAQVMQRGDADVARKTSITGLAQLRMAVSFIDPDGLMQVRTLDIGNNGSLSEMGSAATEGLYFSSRIVKSSGSLFATAGQINGQIWTGNGFGLLGGNTGNDVVHFDPFTKIKLGWLNFLVVNESGPHSLLPVDDPDAHAIKVRVPGHRLSEYFLLEYRKRDSVYESGLPDEGLALWHVDEDENYPEPFVSLQWLGGSSSTALWSEEDAGLTLFDDSSSPAGARWNDFTTSGISISGVTEANGRISFQVDLR